MKRTSSVTLHDVAKRAGVHFSTVSRALNPATRQLVSTDVAARIVAAAKALRYQPNEAAVGLKTKRSFQINIMLPDLADPACGPLVSGIRERLINTRYVAIVGDEERLVGQERYSLQAMKMRPLGGLILATAKLRDKFVDEAVEENVPLVQVLRVTKQRVCSTVAVDHALGMNTVVSLLQAHGHSRIGLVCRPPVLSTGLAETAGFRAAMRRAGLDADDKQTEAADQDDIALGGQAFMRLRARNPKLTAVITTHDRLALGCIDAARGAGLSCPEQMSVVGFGNLPFVDRLSPALTTMRIDYPRIGRTAADLMIRAIEDPEGSPIHSLIEPELVARGSVGHV